MLLGSWLNAWTRQLKYNLKTSAARFHEHLAKSLLRLGFTKSKHDNDLWMIDKTSHYEYLATYVDDILVWSKDPMGVIKFLEKVYLLKNVGIPEYYLGGNVEILGDAWKNQGLEDPASYTSLTCAQQCSIQRMGALFDLGYRRHFI
jgi:hypothetical protein